MSNIRKFWNIRLLASLSLVLVTILPLAARAEGIQSVLHSLDYLAVDYPGAVANGMVVSEDEYAEQKEFSEHLLTSIAALPQKPGRDTILEQVRQLYQKILNKADGNEVAEAARSAGQQLAQLYNVRRTPRAVPDLKMGAELFHGKCVSCHGQHGFGDGPTAAKLDPPPINFHDRERAMERSVYGLYSAISLGVEGTKMRSFSKEMSESQRWALAFYVSNFAFSDEQRNSGEKSWKLEKVAPLTDVTGLTQLAPSMVAAEAGDKGLMQLAWLRAHPEAVMKNVHPLDTTLENLSSSLASYKTGNVDQAYREAVAAYLEGFELAEPALRASNPELLARLEQQMLAYRGLIKAKAPQSEVEADYKSLAAAVEQVRDGGSENTLSSEAGAVSAAVILLREGLEAILILAAITGVLLKTGRRDAMPYLHAGWIGALVLGGATWWVSTYLFAIGGANREMTEGITALLAAVVLVYVGFWLHGKTNAKRWREFVDTKIKGAMHGSAMWALSLVAFLAVYREVFETVLFYQALWLQTEPGQHASLWGGVIAGAAGLLLLAWVILRLSMRLPLRPFFVVNSAIMFVLAVAFSGHGVAALQVAGILPSDPLPLPRVELLGFYPTVETLVTQLIVAALVIFILLRERFNTTLKTATVQ
jgi:high-affinity iron transporter